MMKYVSCVIQQFSFNQNPYNNLRIFNDLYIINKIMIKSNFNKKIALKFFNYHKHPVFLLGISRFFVLDIKNSAIKKYN